MIAASGHITNVVGSIEIPTLIHNNLLPCTITTKQWIRRDLLTSPMKGDGYTTVWLPKTPHQTPPQVLTKHAKFAEVNPDASNLAKGANKCMSFQAHDYQVSC